MILNRLKMHIGVHLFFLLGIAMLLVNVVLIMLVQNYLLKTEMAKADLFLAALQNGLLPEPEEDSLFDAAEFEKRIAPFLSVSAVSGILILDEKMDALFLIAPSDVPKQEMMRVTRNAIRIGEKTHNRFGSTWGVFWVKPEYIIVAAPRFVEGGIAGGVCTVLPLHGLYQRLRHFQQLLAVYILINTFIFTLIGLYRISKIIVKPIHNLLERAEGYQGDGEIFFSDEKRENEFSQLSRALNRMFYRISENKEELRATVRSLENANRELKKAQNDIINAEKLASVGRLSAGIAHEIGNPAAIVVGYLDLLKRTDIDETEKLEFIRRAEAEINRISRIIRQLLDFAKPSDGDLKPVSVHQVIQEVLEVIRFQPFICDIDVRLSLNGGSDRVKADPYQLQQVFLNLIINAADAIRSKPPQGDGKLCISTENGSAHEDSEGNALLKVQFIDNGIGISAENITTIFDPFFTTKDTGQGTGLGLSVCFMIVEAIGGKIKAVSEEGKGTTMILHLPLHPGDAHEHENGTQQR